MYMDKFTHWNFELVDFMEDLVRVFDKTGLIVYTNSSMKKFLENEEGKFCVFSDDDIHRNDQIFSSLKCVAPIGHKEDVKTELLSVGERDFFVKSSPIFDDKNEYWGSIEVFRDITEENKIQKDLVKYQEMVKNDMITASDIQKSLLSKLSHTDGLNLEYKYYHYYIILLPYYKDNSLYKIEKCLLFWFYLRITIIMKNAQGIFADEKFVSVTSSQS